MVLDGRFHKTNLDAQIEKKLAAYIKQIFLSKQRIIKKRVLYFFFPVPSSRISGSIPPDNTIGIWEEQHRLSDDSDRLNMFVSSTRTSIDKIVEIQKTPMDILI